MTPANETDADKKKADKPSRESYSFLNNAQDGSAKSKTNLIQVPSITLPQGGGAIKSIDEKFSVNPANGTAGFSLPLPFSPGRNGQNPALSLSYNSGGGNSIFGIGWGIDIAAIQRRTDKKLPEYKDAEESDVFMISGAEDLVPMLKQDAGGNWVKAVSTANGITRTLYRPRIESAFSRIEKVDDNGNLYWVTRTKENLVAVFGKSDDTKLYDPGAAGKDRIQKWCLEYSYDDKGNFVQYSYKKENKDLLLPSLAEKNRLSDMAPFANIYLKAIRYGNVNAWYEGDPLPSDFLFELVLDYGEHDLLKPTTKEIKPWTLRPDPFSNFKAGFEIRTYRLCRRVLMFHHFQNEFGWNDYLVRSLLFEYDEQPHITYLERIIQTGYIWNTDGSLKSRKSIPPLEFSYFKPGFSREVQELPPDSLIHDPVGLDGKFYQWTDLYSEGISGILTEQGNGWYYKENRGNGIFSPARLISPKPSFTGLSSGVLTIQDLQADGSKYVVKLDGDVKGYFPISAKGEAEPFHTFDHFPNIDLKDPNLKFLDLDGDGMPDMLISQAQEFIWYASKGISGYDDYHLAARAADAERGPQVLFSSQDEALLIATADMSGDGLSDIVLITCSGVSYYPNLGYGKFGVRVNMVMEDVFDASEQFNVKNIHFSDIDGSGTTDIIYTGNGRIQIWFNQSGNNLSAVSEFFNPFPALDDESKITFADLLGNGTSCMVWSSALPHYAGSPLRYIDLMNGQKPHILSAYKNNIGKEVTLEYRSSTHYYLDDKKAGNGWVTKLPFPVQCLSKMVVTDKVSQTRFANEYSYHHGYYDAIEREFRGFARVEQRDSEMYETFVVQTQGSGALNSVEQDLWQPTVITKSWYHTGAYLILQKMYHHLQQEYYPQNLLKSGQISDPAVIAALQTYDLPETPLPAGISTEEFAEYSRSLKGLPLRQEVYSDEGSPDLQMHPYTVTQYNYDVQMLQPRSQQCYAVFLSHEKEKLIFNFERNPLDPRIAHSMNLTIDPFGNVIDAASVIYGRKKPDPKLPLASDRAKQTAQYITWSHNNYTAPIDTDICFRLPVSCEAETWELNAPLPATNYFTCDELKQIFNAASVKLYEQTTGLNEKRKIEHARTLFLRNDLNGPMPLGQLDTRGLPCENYLLAFTPTLLQSLYGGKQDESLLRNKARYVRSEGDSNYWIRSGKTYYHPDLSATPGILSIPPPTAADVVYAKSNFFAPVAFEDNFGNLTKVFYDSYKLQINRRIDALQNETNIDAFNYRTLTPYLMRDANNNRSGVRFDELGLVTHAFVMGKEGEFNGDWLDTTSAELSALDQPTSVVTYAFRYFDTAGKLPCSVKMSVREQHYYTEPQPAGQPGGIQGWLNALFGSGGGGSPPITVNVTWQDNYAYSDGSGHVVLKKIQAEPGPAPQRNAQGVLITDASGKPQLSDTAPEIRWVGNGKTIYNNKGKPVKQYEPYFDSSPEYNTENELCLLGHTSVLFYDAPGRLIRTEKPEGTFTKVEFDAWTLSNFDSNDTVLLSKWYSDRIGGQLGPDEQQAAQQAAVHADTPAVTWLDSLARPFLAMSHNKTLRSNETVQEEFYYIRTELDIEGNARSMTDARGNEVMNWQYDMLGNICFQHSMEAGNRWMLADAMGKPLRLWDSRQQIFSYEYDNLHRPLNMLVNTGAGDQVYEQYVYGEGITDDVRNNLRGKIYQQRDLACQATLGAYDFKGNLLTASKQLLSDYKNLPDWNSSPSLEAETFSSETSYDALNRPVEILTPDASVFHPKYNEGNLLTSMDIELNGSNVTSNFISRITYDAKRQREQILYGNNTTTRYSYDPYNYRLIRLLTTGNTGNNILQDLAYTYDPEGNIILQYDNAQKTNFYGGQQVMAQSNYIYDALYRLIEGGGREHTGQMGFNGQDNWNDSWSSLTLQPNSPVQLRNYSQKYFYDSAGNILKMQHLAGPMASWTRTYAYNPANNQLTGTTAGTGKYTYSYNAHGSMLSMPQLQQIDWNVREEMQHAALGGGGDAYYTYDCNGQRMRKVIEQGGQITSERIYLGALEIYRERNKGKITLERQTLHVKDDTETVALVETRTAGKVGLLQLIRYQYANQQRSVSLELDDAGKIISWEEYHPFGTTAFRATDASRQVSYNRYRYTGMERDDETGLSYHTARYYIPWLGRWTAADPIGIKDGLNQYAYVKNNPVMKLDPGGKAEADTSNVDVTKLRPINDELNKVVNDKLEAIRKEMGIKPGDVLTDDVKKQFAQKVSDLGMPRGGSPVSAFRSWYNWNAIYNKTNIEKYAEAHFDTKEAGDKYEEAIKEATSGYHGGSGTAWAFWNNLAAFAVGKTAVDPSVVVTDKSGARIAIGTDKLGHFFAQGYEMFEVSVVNKKGDTEAENSSHEQEMGKYGLKMTGVYSHADREANRQGMQFYKDIMADPFMKFDIANYASAKMNEESNPNVYSSVMEDLLIKSGKLPASDKASNDAKLKSLQAVSDKIAFDKMPTWTHYPDGTMINKYTGKMILGPGPKW